MIFNIKIDDTKKILDFLNITDSESVDVCISNNTALFICNTVDIFVTLKMNCKSSVGAKDVSFRIKSSFLSKLVIEGSISFEFIEDNQIKVSFKHLNNSIAYSFIMKKQIVYRDLYADKLNILTNIKNYEKIDLSELELFRKITSTNDCILNISNKVASLNYGNIRVYKEVNMNCNFAVYTKTFRALTKFSNYVFNIENFLCIATKELFIVANKCKLNNNEEYAYLKEQKSAYRSVVDFTNLRYITNKLNIKDEYAIMDFEKKSAEIKYKGTIFSVPLVERDVKHSDNFKLGQIGIPLHLLKGIFNKIPNCEFVYDKKKYFSKLEQNGLILIFRS